MSRSPCRPGCQGGYESGRRRHLSPAQRRRTLLFRTVPGEIDIGIFDPSAACNAANVFAVVDNSAVMCICFKLCKFLSFDLLVRITELRLRKFDVQVKRIVCVIEIYDRRIRILQSRLRIPDRLIELLLVCSILCQSCKNLLCFFDFSHQILVGLNIIGCLLELRFASFSASIVEL